MNVLKFRNKITFIFIITLLFLCAPALPALPAEKHAAQYKIGVLANRGKEQCLRQWYHTALDLQDKIPGATFTIVPLNFGETESAVKNRAVDFIITNSGDYVGLEARYGAQRIATLKNFCFDKVITDFGGVIFTRADREGIQQLENLKHKKFIAVDKNSFGGWLAAWRELKECGINPYRDFTEMKFGGTQDAVVRAVQTGEADAGTVRTDTLELMAAEGKIRLQDFRILHTPQANFFNYPHFPFLFSTRLYPEWPFARLQHIPLEITEKVCMALFSIQRDDIAAVSGQYAGWTTPLNYQSVHECLKELRYKPYEDFGRITFRDVLRKYWLMYLLTALLIVIMAFVINYVSGLNRKLKASEKVILQEKDKLEESESKLRSILDDSAEGIMLTDEQGIIIEWNISLEMISGFRYSEVVGRPIWDVQFDMALDEHKTPATYEQLKATLTELLQTGASPRANKPMDHEFKRRDGTRCFIQTLISPIQTSRGFMIAGFQVDVSERKQADEALAQLSRRTKHILSSAGEGILGLDNQGKHTFINPAAAGLLGYAPQDLIGIPAHITWHHTKSDGSRYPVEECPIYASYRNGIPHTAENEVFWRKDGTSFPVEYTSTPIFEDGSSITGAVVTFRDISARKTAEQQLMETKDYLENIIKSSWDAIIISDNTGRITKCNRSFLNIVGYTENEIIGRNVYEFSPLTDGAYESSTGQIINIDSVFFTEAKISIENFMETGTITGWQTYLIRADNIVVPVEENIVFLFNDSGERIGAVGTIRDITERRRTEEERERLIAELRGALSQVKQLGGLLPICASCKKIRDDRGYWQQIEGYIRDHSEAEFSHSICPDCAKKLYPDLYSDEK